MQISEGVIRLKPRPIIANYTALRSRQLKQNRWICGLLIVIKG